MASASDETGKPCSSLSMEEVEAVEPEDPEGSCASLTMLLAQVKALLRRPGRLYWIGASPALPTLWFFWPPWFAPDGRGRFLKTRRAYLEALQEVLCRIERLRRVPDPARQGRAFWLAEHLRAELQERLTWYEIRPGPTWPPWDMPVRSSRAGRSRGADLSSAP
ncbi:hypothetical protein [Thermogemmatispora carboxidivorans]|uniref:hypothetical protein n=1 Tax=Thermogemmatispora carboxidivorans TaxID=1382306 RepID=UPI0012DFB75B|nr:hypothetical protein [Thermogemmatispora carboxidivorans]